MGDEDDGLVQLAPQIKQIVVEPKARDLVERRERLVQQQDIRVGDERARQRDPHLHAAGQFTGICIGKFGKAYLRQRLLDAPVGVGRRCVRKLQGQAHVLAHACPRHQRRLLKHKTDGMPPIRPRCVMGNVHRARARRAESRDQPQRG